MLVCVKGLGQHFKCVLIIMTVDGGCDNGNGEKKNKRCQK